jgi:hypothetical protein
MTTPLEPVAGEGVGDRQSEKAKAEGQQKNIEHCVPLSNARYALERLCN